MLAEGLPPYTNFAVFGPHGSRLVTKLKLRGHQFTTDGRGNHAFGPIQIFGPPGISYWDASWKVFQNCMFMLDAVDLGTLEAYRNKIHTLQQEYGGRDVWLLLYQTDVRARSERIQRVQLDLVREHAAAQASNTASPYDPNRPWNAAFLKLTNDSMWWFE